MEIKKGEVIYQYYSLNTFDSIIKNKELWFSDIKKMNDTNEDKQVFIFLKQEFRKILKEIFEEEKKQKDYEIRQELLERIEEVAKEKKFEKHLLELKKYSVKKDSEKLKNLKKKRNKIGTLMLLKNIKKDDKFISCFSKKGDLLGQWRSYGDDGKGIAIGYRLDKLNNILCNINKIKFDIDKIEYLDDNIDLNKIFRAFEKYKEFLKIFDDLIETLSQDSRDNLERELATQILDTDLFQIVMNFSKDITSEDKEVLNNFKELFGSIDVSTFFKHGGFDEEEEIRILIKKEKDFELNKEKNKEKNKSYISENGFRISQKKDDFIEYIKLILTESDFEMAISEIIIGPNNSINEDYMKKILSKYNLNIDIKKSKIPYKN